ncbi:MAG TPA: hypothetical protein VK688_05960 [Gemmatimonadales bacterium]|nr:hypothetical protein [Gemmatimonadales bacterium]
MTRLLTALFLTAALLGGPSAALAHDAYDDSESNPLRIVAYALHPVGFVLEWVAMRPMHFIVSTPQLERIFGHAPHESPFGGYEAYEPDPQ